MKLERVAVLAGHEHPIYAVSASKKEHIFFTAGGEGAVIEWSLKKMAHIKVMFKMKAAIYTMCSSEEPNVLLAGDRTGLLSVFDFESQQLVQNVQAHHGAVFGITVQGSDAYSVGEDGFINRYSLQSNELIERKQISNGHLRAVEIHPSLPYIAVGGKDMKIYILDKKELSVIKILDYHTLPVFSLRFSADGHYLISGARDAQIKLFDLLNGFQLVENIPAHLFTVNDLLLLPGSDFFLSASRDKSIKLWNSSDLKLYQVLDAARAGGHQRSVNALAFCKYENTVISVSDDKMIIVWKVTEE